ncbi:hypothetical protein P7K49_009408 [Saguinus oedipus]|uniref:Uncharacterized protein n=1 Tax=Saguinus oedipus TaxID=9490 RepID=A0ABQ9VK91_SAGOE|nr:hypothetical protein P7K49_009408 [Saguinus oedipus]
MTRLALRGQPGPGLFRRLRAPDRGAPSRPPGSAAWGSVGLRIRAGTLRARTRSDQHGPCRQLGAGGFQSHREANPSPGFKSQHTPPAPSSQRRPGRDPDSVSGARARDRRTQAPTGCAAAIALLPLKGELVSSRRAWTED